MREARPVWSGFCIWGPRMLRISSTYTGIAQGQIALFDHFAHPTPMWTDTGPRAARAQVVFNAPFLAPPVVHLSIGLIDQDHAQHQRLVIEARNVSETGFIAEARTWSDTRLARLALNWMAIGAVDDPDEAWDV